MIPSQLNIKEKLEQLNRLPYQKETLLNYHTLLQRSDYQINKVIPGKYLDSIFGACFYREKEFPLDHFHGTVQLSSYLKKTSLLLSLIAKNAAFDGVDLRKTVFLDSETTGLSGGAGICAFLVGIGYFTEESFRIVQYFMNDYNEERALLYHINNLIQNHNLMISYNGKCFDIPLLISRNVYYRIESPFSRILHLDLLFSVRRLWKHKLSDCTLGTVETKILKASRMGDIPSYRIPQIYFEYLRNKDARPLKAIFYHNQQDILALVALTSKTCQMFENPLEESDTTYDILTLGKVYEGFAKFQESNDLYNQYLKEKSEKVNTRELLLRMAFNYKKLKEWSKASEIWEQCITSEKFHPLPYIELAKYYEHKEKNYSRAKCIVDKAIEELKILEELNGTKDLLKYKKDLEYRQKRLTKKFNESRWDLG